MLEYVLPILVINIAIVVYYIHIIRQTAAFLKPILGSSRFRVGKIRANF